MNSNVVGPNQIIKVGPMQVDKLNLAASYLSQPSWSARTISTTS